MKLEFLKKRKFWLWALVVLILVLLLIYFYSYFFAKKHNKVIFQDEQRRIYLIEKKGYNGRKDREMWRMVYEDQKTGLRTFITGNAPKGFSEKKMSEIVINTIEKGKKASFDQVQRVGVTLAAAKTDVHSNLIDKKSFSDFVPEFPELGFNL